MKQTSTDATDITKTTVAGNGHWIDAKGLPRPKGALSQQVLDTENLINAVMKECVELQRLQAEAKGRMLALHTDFQEKYKNKMPRRKRDSSETNGRYASFSGKTRVIFDAPTSYEYNDNFDRAEEVAATSIDRWERNVLGGGTLRDTLFKNGRFNKAVIDTVCNTMYSEGFTDKDKNWIAMVGFLRICRTINTLDRVTVKPSTRNVETKNFVPFILNFDKVDPIHPIVED